MFRDDCLESAGNTFGSREEETDDRLMEWTRRLLPLLDRNQAIARDMKRNSHCDTAKDDQLCHCLGRNQEDSVSPLGE